MTNSPVKKRRNINTINKIIEILENGELNTRAIHARLQETWPRWCPGMSRLSNILSRQPEFTHVKREFVRADDRSGSYTVIVWALSDGGDSN